MGKIFGMPVCASSGSLTGRNWLRSACSVANPHSLALLLPFFQRSTPWFARCAHVCFRWPPLLRVALRRCQQMHLMGLCAVTNTHHNCFRFWDEHVPCLRMQVKHLFPPEAAAEVWARCEPIIARSLSVECYHALLLLLSFFPHRALSAGVDLPWNAWAQRALQLWGSMQQQLTWDHLWLAFFARLAKADTFVRFSPSLPSLLCPAHHKMTVCMEPHQHQNFGGALHPLIAAPLQDKIDWEAHMTGIVTHVMWHFRVPAGGSTTGHAIQLHDAADGVMLSHATNNETSSCGRLAKILVCTLRRDLRQDARQAGGTTPLKALQSVLTLLGHYYHAGNSGSCATPLLACRLSLCPWPCSWPCVHRESLLYCQRSPSRLLSVQVEQ